MGKKVLMQGNEACVMGAIAAGMRFFAGYPITPSTEIAEISAQELPKVGGRFLQMEDEISGAAAAIGASVAGVKAMTATSGPGFSLKQEHIGYAAEAEIPVVVVDVQRVGPSTGLPTSPAQGDLMQARWGTHGDHPAIVISPATVKETYLEVIRCFNLAEKYRTPVMLLADGIIGQMMEPVEFHEHEKRELPDKPWAVTGYDPKSGRERSIVNSLYIEVDELQEMNDRLQARYKEIQEKEVMVEKYNTEGAEVIICAYGTVARICKSAIALCAEKGVKVGLVRPITLWPFPEKELNEAMAQDSVKRELTVEISAGQMHEDVRLAIDGKKPTDFYGKPGSYTPTAEEIAEYILKTREA